MAKPHGKIGVIDVFTKVTMAHSKLHNLLEKLRDNSHVKVLSLEELRRLARDVGLVKLKTRF